MILISEQNVIKRNFVIQMWYQNNFISDLVAAKKLLLLRSFKAEYDFCNFDTCIQWPCLQKFSEVLQVISLWIQEVDQIVQDSKFNQIIHFVIIAQYWMESKRIEYLFPDQLFLDGH